MKTRHVLLAGGLALLAAGCGGGHGRSDAPAPPAVSAVLATVEGGSAPRLIEAQGVVMPGQESYLSSRAMGPVVGVHATSGDVVRKGQLLLEIQQDLSHGQLSQALGARTQADAALALAQRNVERFQKLYDRQSCSELELDMARMQFEQAKGAVEQASGAVSAAGSVAGESEVRAPFDAIVVERMVDQGDLCAPGRPLLRLQSRSGTRIWLTVREADAPYVKTGMELPVTLDSRPDLGTLRGRVAEIVPAADPATHTFTVRVDLPPGQIMSGLSGKAVIPGESRRALLAPAAAIYQAGGLSLAAVVDAQSLARSRAVTTGARRGDRIEVLTGLAAGDRVVSPLTAPVADGTPIQASAGAAR
jgi:RND family efflux transporter MFP subunit